jgi:hypothetical protein
MVPLHGDLSALRHSPNSNLKTAAANVLTGARRGFGRRDF